jgi:hypothetical protein
MNSNNTTYSRLEAEARQLAYNDLFVTAENVGHVIAKIS